MTTEFFIEEPHKINNVEEILKELGKIKKSPIESRVLKKFIAGCFLASERMFSPIPKRLISIKEILNEGTDKTRFELRRLPVQRRMTRQEYTTPQRVTQQRRMIPQRKPMPQTQTTPKQEIVPIRISPMKVKTLPQKPGYQQTASFKKPDIVKNAPLAPKDHEIEFNGFKLKVELDGMYVLKEPMLNERDIQILNTLMKKTFMYEPKKVLNKENLAKKLKKLTKKLGVQLTPEYINKIHYYIQRNFGGLGKIEPLLHDPDVNKIIADSSKKKVIVYYNKKKYETNIMFKDKKEMNNLIIKLAAQIKKKVSEKEPVLEGSLPFGAKVEATFGSEYSQANINITK